MEYYTLLLFILVCYGTTNIIVNGSIFNKFRELSNKIHPMLGKLFSCMRCTATWVGFAISSIFILCSMETPCSIITPNIYIVIFMCGMISSGTVWLLHTIQEYFDKSK